MFIARRCEENQFEMQTLYDKANIFLTSYHSETGRDGLPSRLSAVEEEIRRSGTYVHTPDELTFGVRVAWRNSNRCIGRLFWKSLTVEDKRNVTGSAAVMEAIASHLTLATNGGRIRPVITVFPPRRPDGVSPVRVWNKQLIRYAGYRQADGKVIGDPAQLEFTGICQSMGWKGEGTGHDVLPVIVQCEDSAPVMFPLHPSLVMEVNLTHPSHEWFATLGLKWQALPVISDMVLEIGGILYPAAPFNGWYMVTEIGSRNLGDADRYDMLPVIAERLGLDLRDRSVFWKDRALIVLNEAVRYSYERAGVTIVDHHDASDQFMKFMRNEERSGRDVTADWAWIVPPMAGSALAVFHQTFNNEVKTPNYFYNHDAWKEEKQVSKCPFHADSLEHGEK